MEKYDNPIPFRLAKPFEPFTAEEAKDLLSHMFSEYDVFVKEHKREPLRGRNRGRKMPTS